MPSKYSSLNDRVRKSEGRQATAAESVGLNLKGNFEQRRSGRGNEENKAACFECGSTDHLRLYDPFGLPEDERWQVFWRLPKTRMKKGGKGGKKGKSKSANFTCLATQSDKENEAGQEVNMATRKVKWPGILGAGRWEEKEWLREEV